jgi:hypothetical protein
LIALVLAIAALALPAAADTHVFAFDDDSYDWTVFRINIFGTVFADPAEWNPDGYLAIDVDWNVFDRSFGLATGAENWDGIAGGTFTVDYRAQGDITNLVDKYWRFFVASGDTYYVTTDEMSWSPEDVDAWTTFSVDVMAENFLPLYDTTMSFDEVLAGADTIGVVFTGSADEFDNVMRLGFSSQYGATMAFDNFSVATASVPEPAALVLLAAGGLVALRRGICSPRN